MAGHRVAWMPCRCLTRPEPNSYYLSMKRIVFLPLLFMASFLSAAPKIITSYYLSLFETPKYAEGFTHFEYVNPDAPKGGTRREWAQGTYDSFNAFPTRGVAGAA